MAIAQECLDEILSCQVCFEEFTEDGAHVPRILPCSHTLCHTCVGRLIKGTWIECPECRMKHEAKKEEKSLPQNKYILVQMKRTLKLQRDHETPEKCREHGKELNIFCKEPGCQMMICLSCLSRDHKKHDFIEIDEIKKNFMYILQKDIETATDKLQRKIQSITDANKETTKKIEENIEELKMKKQEMVKQYDKIIKDTEDEIKQVNFTADQDLKTIKQFLILLQSQSAKAIEGDNVNELSTATDIIKKVNKLLN